MADGLGEVGWEVAESGAAVDDVGVFGRVCGLAELPAVGDDCVEGVLVGGDGLVDEVGLWAVQWIGC